MKALTAKERNVPDVLDYNDLSGKSYGDMCETIATAIADGVYTIRNRATGAVMPADAHAVFCYSRSGELFMIPGWYLEVCAIRRALKSSERRKSQAAAKPLRNLKKKP